MHALPGRNIDLVDELGENVQVVRAVDERVRAVTTGRRHRAVGTIVDLDPECRRRIELHARAVGVEIEVVVWRLRLERGLGIRDTTRDEHHRDRERDTPATAVRARARSGPTGPVISHRHSSLAWRQLSTALAPKRGQARSSVGARKESSAREPLKVVGTLGREATKQRSSNARPMVRICQRSVSNPVVGDPQLVQELHIEAGTLVLIPAERCLHVQVGSRLGDEPVGRHDDCFARRARTSCAGRARCGSLRYAASRSSASRRWLSGAGDLPCDGHRCETFQSSHVALRDPTVQRILRHLGLPTAIPEPARARPRPTGPGPTTTSTVRRGTRRRRSSRWAAPGSSSQPSRAGRR